MTSVAILPVPTATGDIVYHAIARDKQSHGKTAGEALDRLAAQLHEDETGTLVILQRQRPDAFLDETKQRRLAELMGRWRAARDSGATLPSEKQAELDALIAEELHAAEKRTAALLRNLAQ